MANEGKEVGIIGQMYEQRKTHQIGVLESRDDKYKTLLFRDSEGKSFNVTYATFHSSWRKYTGEESIQTSTQVEEEKSQKKEKIEKAEKKVEEVAKQPKISRQEQVQMVHATKEIIEGVFASHNLDVVIKITYKGAITVRCLRRGVLEIWLKYGKDLIDIYIADAVSELIKIPEYATVVRHENWRFKTRATIPSKKLKNFIESNITVIRKYGETITKENKEKKSNKEEEN